MATEVTVVEKKRWQTRLEVVTTAAMLVAAVLVILAVARGLFTTGAPLQAAKTLRGGAEAPIPKEPLSLDGASLRGSRAAKVGVLEFTDYECPFCGTLARDSLSSLMRDYVDTGRVLFALRNLPLEQIHKSAVDAARAALCAGEQGQYWPMHDALFADQRQLDRVSIQKRQTALGLDLAMSNRCVESKAIGDRIEADVAAARAIGVSGTPAMLIGSVQPDGRLRVIHRVSGARPKQEIQQIIDELLRQR